MPTGYTVDTPNVIHFHLIGQEFNFPITQFNLAFGFITQEYVEIREYVESTCDYIEPFFSHYHDIWKEMSINGDRYDPCLVRTGFL